MTREQYLNLRRQCRRDEHISDGAARLFAEITDLHLLENGCFAGDTKLAAWIGCSSRTVRRRRHELTRAGYLSETTDGTRRHLIPTTPDGQPCRTSLTDKSGQWSEMADKSGHVAPDKSGQHREYNIPPEAGERAGASEQGRDQARESADPPTDPLAEEFGVSPPAGTAGAASETDSPVVAVYADIIGRPNSYQASRLREIVEPKTHQLKALRAVCLQSMDAVDGNPKRVNFKYLVKDLRREIKDARRADQLESGDGFGPPAEAYLRIPDAEDDTSGPPGLNLGMPEYSYN